MDLQQFKLEGSRCFHLDVPGALLLVGERLTMPGGSCSKLRKVKSIACEHLVMHACRWLAMADGCAVTALCMVSTPWFMWTMPR
jgi:hypothetical protein